MPKKAHDDDFCYDVVATSCKEIAPNVWEYGTGLALQVNGHYRRFIESEERTICFDARARSSVWKTGMVLSNCYGTIDAGYTGEIKAVFYHVMPNMPKYEVGDKIFQICLAEACDAEFIEVGELDATERGEGGYGSTGK